MENIIGIHADIRYNLSWNLFKLCRMPEPDTKIFLLSGYSYQFYRYIGLAENLLIYLLSAN
jgi:hypothetical protein